MKRSRIIGGGAGLAFILLASLVEPAFLAGGGQSEVLIGLDDDNTANSSIQPPGVAANQSLNNADALVGGGGHDVLIGLLGSDVLRGGPGHDVLIGGTEQGTQPNSDVIFGDEGADVNIWAPGDGSDAFIGDGGSDAMIFGVIDRSADNVPILNGVTTGPHKSTGLPSAELTNSPGFCTIETVGDPESGFEFLARFFVRATGNLAVTIRLSSVEQVFCTSTAGGAITFADLTAGSPQFVEVSLEEVERLNETVAQIVR